MWKLTIEDDQGNRIPVPLVRDDYSIGRAVENTLRLTERNVSRQHASLRQEAGRWVLLDLDSYNGSYVNGERVIERQELADGDLIQLGDYRIELAEEAGSVVAPPAIEEAESAASIVGASAAGGAIDTVAKAPAEPMAPMEQLRAAEEQAAPLIAESAEEELDLDFIPGTKKGRGAWPGLAIGGVAVLALGGLAFAMLRPEASTAEQLIPTPTEVAQVEALSAPPQPAREAEEAVVEVAQAESIDLDEPMEPAATELAAAEPVALAKATAEQAAAPTRALSASVDPKPPARAAAPTKPAGGERRSVLAANPFDPPSGGRKGAKPTSEPAPGGGGSLTSLAAQGREGEAKMRPILEQRVARGNASTDDIKLLRAICRNMGDRVCADRMTALLAQK